MDSYESPYYERLDMYIGGGLIVFILVVVLIVFLVRRA
jgi:hypothetical protein